MDSIPVCPGPYLGAGVLGFVYVPDGTDREVVRAVGFFVDVPALDHLGADASMKGDINDGFG